MSLFWYVGSLIGCVGRLCHVVLTQNLHGQETCPHGSLAPGRASQSMWVTRMSLREKLSTRTEMHYRARLCPHELGCPYRQKSCPSGLCIQDIFPNPPAPGSATMITLNSLAHPVIFYVRLFLSLQPLMHTSKPSPHRPLLPSALCSIYCAQTRIAYYAAYCTTPLPPVFIMSEVFI